MVGDELAIVGLAAGGLTQIARHRLSTPGQLRATRASSPSTTLTIPAGACPARRRSGDVHLKNPAFGTDLVGLVDSSDGRADAAQLSIQDSQLVAQWVNPRAAGHMSGVIG